ncbi:MAG: phosphate acyltransferase PlsX [Thiotrichaceae bacterium]|nr:phosphate acyltransferase PlsX [Thiotrichaceae bacterium]
MTPRIALDAMSGDFGVDVTVPSALQILREHKDLYLTLVGDADVLKQKIGQLPAQLKQRITIHHTSQVVEMDEKPSLALKKKKDSSMRVAINLVKSGEVDACVSAGNTGALMATARYVLKTLPGIDRPAIISTIPTMNGHTHMLDLGANVDSSSEHLLQFAVMGSVLTSAVDNIDKPRIGLLNIGQEEMKGNERVKETARLLADLPINYIGFVEGDDIFKGTADVIVCDGFVGNVALKTCEGVAKMIAHYAKQSFSQNLYARLAGLIALPVIKSLKRKIDPRRYNGASLLGLRGIVIKSHGSADIVSFSQAIEEAIIEVEKNVPTRISNQLAALLTQNELG